jgi:hypothetical protein
MRAIAGLAVLTWALGGCASSSCPAPSGLSAEAQDGSAVLDRASAWLAGSFSSAEQAATDERYFAVLLHHVPIWPGRDDGRWLYVEQALADAAGEPYRQRIYRLWVRPDGLLESTVYELPDPAVYVGGWSTPAAFDAISPLDLTRRDGCEVVFDRVLPDRLMGSTADRACPSDLRGAVYASSEVLITAHEIRSWDRGFDAEGAQVWGAEAGPYRFRRVQNP